MPRLPSVVLHSNERVAFVGKTGSGKTFLAKYFLKRIRRVIALDPKGTLRPEIDSGWNLEEDSESARRVLRNGGYGRLRIPAPIDGDWREILQFVWNLGNVTLYIDEVYGVVPINSRAPDELNTLYTRGRERNIGVWAATQRPAWIPMIVLSEAEWLFTLRLLLEQDRKRMAEVCGPRVMIPVRDEHGFWIYNTSWDEPIYSSGLRVRQTNNNKQLVSVEVA